MEDGAVLGEGASALTVSVTGMDGKTITVTVHTDEKTVGEALEKAGLIAGEESEFGLYVKTINGETVDYDTDGAFWAFYVDGVMAATGVDPGPGRAFRRRRTGTVPAAVPAAVPKTFSYLFLLIFCAAGGTGSQSAPAAHHTPRIPQDPCPP